LPLSRGSKLINMHVYIRYTHSSSGRGIIKVCLSTDNGEGGEWWAGSGGWLLLTAAAGAELWHNKHSAAKIAYYITNNSRAREFVPRQTKRWWWRRRLWDTLSSPINLLYCLYIICIYMKRRSKCTVCPAEVPVPPPCRSRLPATKRPRREAVCSSRI